MDCVVNQRLWVEGAPRAMVEACAIAKTVFGRVRPVKVRLARKVEGRALYEFPRFFNIDNAHARDPPRTLAGAASKHFPSGPMILHRTLDPARGQPGAVQATMDCLARHGGAVLCLPCGFGKTTCALALAAHLGHKTFVMVHTESIAEQWVQVVAEAFPAARVLSLSELKAVSQEALFEADFVVGLIQRVITPGVVPAALKEFGLLVVDEAHHVPAESFYRATAKFNPAYSLGLTATPTRADGMTNLLFWTLGPLAYKLSRPDANALLVGRGTAPAYEVRIYHVYHAMPGPLPADPAKVKFALPALVNHLTEMSERSELACALIRDLVSLPGDRHCLALTARRAHAKSLVEALGPCAFAYLGGMSRAKIPADVRVLVSTPQMFGEGADFPRLDTLLLLTPVSQIEQLLGRVMRDHPDKASPVVIVDLVDEDYYGVVKGMARRRASQYTTVLPSPVVRHFDRALAGGALGQRAAGGADCDFL